MEKLRESHPRRTELPGGAWLPLRQASHQMGVSAATLRSWADEGRVPSYRTPGGHRRFKVDGEVPAGQPARGQSTRWRLLEYSALGHIRVALEEWAQTRGILLQVPPRARAEHRTLGRELVKWLVTALQQEGKAPEESAARLGKRYANLHRRYGVDARTALTMLGFFRSAFTASVIEFGFGMGEPGPEQFNEWLGRVNQVIDGVTLTMLESMTEETKRDV